MQKIQRDPAVTGTSSSELNPEKNTPEGIKFSEQEKNIQEVFKLNPELESIAVEAVKSGNFAYLYRIENKNISDVPDGVTSHEDLKGQWFSPDLATAQRYLRKSQQTFKQDAQRVMGAHLVIAKVLKQQMDDLHVAKHPIASQMDVESDNYIIPESAQRTYINIDDVQDKVGRIENFNKAKEQINEKVKLFEVKEAVQLYQEYLQSVFPDSKVKDIVWHGTKSDWYKTEKFNPEKIGSNSGNKHNTEGSIYFIKYSTATDAFGSNKMPAKIDLKNPRVLPLKDFNQTWFDKEGYLKLKTGDGIIAEQEEDPEQAYERKIAKYKENLRIYNEQLSQGVEPTVWDKFKFDKPESPQDFHEEQSSTTYVVFDPSQIHILGSTSDMEEFKQFVSGKE